MTTRSLPARPVTWALAVGLALGAIETVKAVVAGRSAPNEFGVVDAVLTNLPWWLLWALLAPLVFRLVDRFPLQRGALVRPAVVHGVASIVVSLFHLVLSALGVWAAVSREFLTLQGTIRQLVAGYLVSDLVTYWAIVAAYSTYASRRRLEASEHERRRLELHAARLEAEAAELRAEMTEARLAALRMELNPHFLYNALNTVSSLTQRGQERAAVDMLARLSDLLRRTLDEHLDHEVPIEQELDLLDLYLSIERVRFADRLVIDVRLDPAVRSALVPTFVLQPLVENAIRHGVAEVRGPASVAISAAAVGPQLEIRVRDSGPGFDPAASAEDGVGLRNTRRRLATLYGDAGTLRQYTLEAGGAEVVLHLPLRVEEGVRVSD